MADQQPDVDNFALACALARENLGAYIQLMDPSYELAYHHEQIVKQLMRVEAGIDRRVLIQAPPRHGKSHTASILFPTWYLGRHPTRKIISASCTQELADDFGAKVRNLVNDPIHRAIFPECQMSSDSQAKNHFRLTAGGEYFAVGRGSTTIGRGANCLVAGTLVTTEHGELPIEALADLWPSTKVLSYDPDTARCEYKRVQAFRARPAARIRRITSSSGRVVESTPDHRIYVAGRYVEARAISSGDRLLRAVRKDGYQGRPRNHQAREARPERVLLLTGLLESIGERAASWAQGVRSLWRAGAEEYGPGHPAGALLWAGMFVGGARGAEDGDQGSMALADLWSVREALPAGCGAVQRGPEVWRGELLFSQVCGQGALSADVSRGQSEVEGRREWSTAASVLRSILSGASSVGSGARRALLRGVPVAPIDAARSPHRREPAEQRGYEPGDVVSEAPSGLACGEGFICEEDPVALVEEICRDVVVYDIQVEGNHNFFANSILLSNCFLVDDLCKDKNEARSVKIQEEAQDWFTTVARTRLEPPNAIVLSETLWSEAGMSAWLPRNQPKVGWKTLRFPAIAEADELTETGEVWRKKGDALWPSKYPLEELAETRDMMRTDDWMCLYQQRATADEGNFFKKQWLEQSYLDRASAGEGMTRYIVVDPANSKKRGSDFTSMWVIGLGTDRNFYPLDVVRDKLSLSERTETLFRLHGEWFPIVLVGYEEYGMAADIAHIRECQERRQYHFTIVPLGGGIRKEERIADLEPIFRTLRMRMPRSMWYQPVAGGSKIDLMKPFLEEYCSFSPVGGTAAHDDMLDSLARITDKALTLDWPMTQQQLDKRAAASRRSGAKGSWMAA